MKPITQSEKERIISRIFWDMEVDEIDFNKLLTEKLNTIENIESQKFFSRLLTSCDWYTLLKLIPPTELKSILNSPALERLYPKDLKEKYLYVRGILSRVNEVNRTQICSDDTDQLNISKLFHNPPFIIQKKNLHMKYKILTE
jgi:hypothetical protein